MCEKMWSADEFPSEVESCLCALPKDSVHLVELRGSILGSHHTGSTWFVFRSRAVKPQSLFRISPAKRFNSGSSPTLRWTAALLSQ